MTLVMLVFWATVVAFGIWVVRSMSPHSDNARATSALDIARGRYARGEISEKEFLRIKTGLLR